jgi:hypothetical protein
MILLSGLSKEEGYFFLRGSVEYPESVFIVFEDRAHFFIHVFRVSFASQHFQVIEETGDRGTDMQVPFGW